MENERKSTRLKRVIEFLQLVYLNLFILGITVGVTYMIFIMHPNWLREEYIIGMLVYPIVINAVGWGLTIGIWATRSRKNFWALFPAGASSTILLFVILLFGPDMTQAYQQHEQDGKTMHLKQEENRVTRLHNEAPTLDYTDVEMKLPFEQGYEIQDFYRLSSQEFQYWVRLSNTSWFQEQDYIGFYDQREYHLSQLKSIDGLWSEVKKQQSITGGGSPEVKWDDLKVNLLTLTDKKSPNWYLVSLKTDGKQVEIDHVDVIHK